MLHRLVSEFLWLVVGPRPPGNLNVSNTFEYVFWLFPCIVQVLRVCLACVMYVWQISSMCLLGFHLQSKVMPSSFSLRDLFMCKSPILSVLASWLFQIKRHLLVCSFISLFKNQFKRSSLISSEAFIISIFSLTTNGVLSSA